MRTLVALFCILPQLHGHNPAAWSWSEATIHHANVLGWYPTGHRPNLEPIVLHDSEVYHPSEWGWDQEDWTRTLTGTIGESIVRACRKMEGSSMRKPPPLQMLNMLWNQVGKIIWLSLQRDCVLQRSGSVPNKFPLLSVAARSILVITL